MLENPNWCSPERIWAADKASPDVGSRNCLARTADRTGEAQDSSTIDTVFAQEGLLRPVLSLRPTHGDAILRRTDAHLRRCDALRRWSRKPARRQPR
jgi:hypothetical protein